MRTLTKPIPRAGRLAASLLLWSVALVVTAQPAFQTLDPFYQDESARRDFYGGLALSGEVGYRSTSLLQPGDAATAGSDALALSLQLDYALLPQVDLAGIVDLSGGVGRGPIGLSWVVLKPYWHNEGSDYAVRIAIDPTSEGGLGFRQTDVAFLSTSTLSPLVTNDFAIGLRRVRAGYDTRTPADGNPPISVSSDLFADAERVRVIGKELHVSWGYNVVFDPGGSRVAVALLGEAGDYTLVRAAQSEPEVAEGETEERVRSGMGWLRAGLEWSRPSYQLSPYVAVPVVTWASVRGEPVRHGPRPDRARFGLRVTLR